ncbi:MAG: hypothetical protein OHK0038_21580 [Flammeovirgaceae bacterium]
MEKEKLIQLISKPQTISRADAASLKELAKQYPYFQAVYALIAKGTQQPEDIQAAAVRTANRAFLRQLMNSDFNPSYHLPDLKGLDIQPEDLNAFEKLAHLEENVSESKSDLTETKKSEEHIPPHHLTVSIVHGEEKESVEVDVQLPEENAEKVQDFDFEAKTNQDEFEKYWEITEHPEKIKEIVLQKVEENAFKEELPVKEDDSESNESSNLQDEDALHQHLQNAMNEIKRLRAEAREAMAQREIESLSQGNNADETSQKLNQEIDDKKEEIISKKEENIEQSDSEQPHSKEEVVQEAKKTLTLPTFDLPNYEMNYSYEEVDKIPYLQEDQPLDEKSSEGMPIFKDKEEIERLQKIVHSIQQDSKANELKEKSESSVVKEVSPDGLEVSSKGESQVPVYQDTGFSINPDFFELHQIIANREETKQVQNLVSEQKLSSTKSSLAWERQKGIIDKFIAIEPQLKIKITEESNEPIPPQENLVADVEISRFQASENLAMILKRQGKIERAIQIYEDLILKYPEKRGYFAAQIEKTRSEAGF